MTLIGRLSTRLMRPRISAPRYSSIGGVSSDSVANTRPQSVVVRSLRGPKVSRLKSFGMPPTPLMPRSKAMPRRLPERS
jgi:hypothetical protein